MAHTSHGMAYTAVQPVCLMCENYGIMLCGGCKSVHYCSKACQKEDWPIHKIVCKDYTTFVTTRPDQDHHSAIIFHPDESKPRFVWLRFDRGTNRPDGVHLAQLGIRGYEVKPNPVNEFAENPMQSRGIPNHHIIISMPGARDVPSKPDTGVTTNNSLAVIDDELTKSFIFLDTVLAFATHCPVDTEKKLSSLDLVSADFRHVVDNLRLAYCKFDSLVDNMMGCTVPGDRAVRLNCLGDSTFLDRAGFESVQVCPVRPDEETDMPTPVADKIGLPLIVRKLPPAVLWRDTQRPCRIKNTQASMLNPPNQSMDTGSLIIIRKDGRPLHPVHVHALITYTALRLKDPKQPKNACLTPDMLLPSRIKYLSKEDFQKWYPKMWQLFPNRPFVPSPFDIPEDFVVDEPGFNLRRK